MATTPSDGWVIGQPAGFLTGLYAPMDAVILLLEADASGDTVTITAGDAPLATNPKADTVVLAASDIRLYKPKPENHIQSDGTYIVTCTDAGTRCYAFILPRQTARGGA